MTYHSAGKIARVDCDYVIGADGFHGVSRKSIPSGVLREYEKVYPFGWLGVLSRTKPVSDELIYARHERGFALCSMRSQVLSRYYIQVPLSDRMEQWSDDAFWAELKRRLPDEVAARLITGPSIEKSIAPLRSYRRRADALRPAVPGRRRRAHRAADRRRGLNTAASDVYYLYQAMTAHYKNGDDTGLDGYSDTGAGAGVESAALLLVDDDAAAQLPGPHPLRSKAAADGSRVSVLVRDGAAAACGKLRGASVLGIGPRLARR